MSLPNDDGLVLLDAQVRKQLRQYARELGLGTYDLLLIGDGSGSTYCEPAGWACIAYDRRLKKAAVHAGSFTAGTNNVAELMPFLHALWWYGQEHRDETMARCRVAIVSDSEVTVRCGNGQYMRCANACWWAGIAWFEQQGCVFHWQHVRRLSDVWNEFADGLAGRCRLSGENMKVEADAIADHLTKTLKS